MFLRNSESCRFWLQLKLGKSFSRSQNGSKWFDNILQRRQEEEKRLNIKMTNPFLFFICVNFLGVEMEGGSRSRSFYSLTMGRSRSKNINNSYSSGLYKRSIRPYGASSSKHVKEIKTGSRICKTVVLYLTKRNQPLKYVQANMHKNWEWSRLYFLWKGSNSWDCEGFRCWELRR